MTLTNAVNRVPFVQIANAMLRDKRLSLKAKGLLSLMLTHREGWQYWMKNLQDMSNDGREAHQSAMKELLATGYVVRKPAQHPVTGKMNGWAYSVTDQPTQAPSATTTVRRESRQTGKPSSGKPATKNNNPKNTNPKKKEVKDMSTGVDASAPNMAHGSQEGQEGHGQGQTPQPPTATVRGHASDTTATSTDKVAPAKPSPKAWTPDPAYLGLLDAYNLHRGRLPEAQRMSKDREKKLMALTADLGSIEAAFIELGEATQASAADGWYISNRYGLDTVLNHVTAKAESYRDAQANGLALAKPENEGRKAQAPATNEGLLSTTLDAMAYYNKTRGQK